MTYISKLDPYDWFCGPGSHLMFIVELILLSADRVFVRFILYIFNSQAWKCHTKIWWPPTLDFGTVALILFCKYASKMYIILSKIWLLIIICHPLLTCSHILNLWIQWTESRSTRVWLKPIKSLTSKWRPKSVTGNLHYLWTGAHC